MFGEASRNVPELKENLSVTNQLKNVAYGLLAAWVVSSASTPVIAANQVLCHILQ